MRLEVPDTLGYSVLLASGGVALVFWMGVQVGKMRRSIKFAYPLMYHPENNLFNCYQRVHQNTLELFPSYLVTLFAGTFGCPKVAPIAGATWLVGRVLFALGYYTGEPKNREFGAIVTFLSQFVLLGCTAYQGYKMTFA